MLGQKDVPPRKVCLQQLRAQGLELDQDWLRAWQDLFAPPDMPRQRDRVLIFPGGGHPAKCWPLERYLLIADWLQGLGYSAVFVLGPAEMERGLKVRGFATAAPENLGQLQDWIRSSGFVLGNDSGPLHLAGFCGVPGLALFGPSPEEQWGPTGIATLSGDAPCRPCTRMGLIDCRDPVCLKSISPERVAEKIRLLMPGPIRTDA
jgi:ADP-heptose:LPS heptosyltransferase